MKLYDYPKAPNPRRLRIYLTEKGIDIPTVQVDLTTGEQLSDDFMSKNPLGTVPMLELDDGQFIVDSLVICRYLEELNPEPALLGKTPLERARVNWWLRRIEHDGLFAVAECFRNKTPHFADRAYAGSFKVPQVEGLIERGYKRTLNFFAVLNEHLKDREFIATEDYTLADISAQVVVDFGRWIQAVPPEDHEALKAWHQRLASRPSAGS